MDAERWQVVKRTMLQALERSPEERPAFLDAACGEDLTLRQEVDTLLRWDRSEMDLLDRPVFELGGEAPVPCVEERGRVGSYCILRKLGRGGMGAVYLAERVDDEYHNQVALKVLTAGWMSETLVRRFRTEGKILARLEHPNIARLLDGGTTADGLPYLALEYVEGEPIDHYCQARGLSIPRRLEIFLQVCEAVQFAHRNLVVHRDLKPSNILVTPDGAPKLLDFGIAKLLAAEGYEADSGMTVVGCRPMTPEYAAPEQVRSEAVTTATDVYSLGVLLFKLLTGRLPYSLRSLKLDELLRAICLAEPESPSSVVERRLKRIGPRTDESVAPPEGSALSPRLKNPPGLRRQLTGDLDSITLKALRKEPGKRYPSVEQLAEDLRRYLKGVPVLARRGSLVYRAGKFVRRNKVEVAAATVCLAVFLSWAASLWIQRREIVRQRDRAEQVSHFLVDMFEGADPYVAGGSSVTAREILDRGSERIHVELAPDPDLQAALMTTMGRVYRHLGLHEPAQSLLEEALLIRRHLHGEKSLPYVDTLDELGTVLQDMGRDADAERLHTEALEVRRALAHGDDLLLVESMNNLGAALWHRGQYAQAERLLRDVLEITYHHMGGEDVAVADARMNLSMLLLTTGDYAEAEALARQSLEVVRLERGGAHPDTLVGLEHLARILAAQGQYEEAESLFRDVLAQQRKVHNPSHSHISNTLNSLALLLTEKGDYRAAEPLYREAIKIASESLGADHAEVANCKGNLAQSFAEWGRFDEAEALFYEALAILRAAPDRQEDRLSTVLNNLALLLEKKGDSKTAAQLHRENVDLRRRVYGEQHVKVANSLHNLAGVLSSRGELEEAEHLYREALTILKKRLGEEHRYVALVMRNLAATKVEKGEFAAGESLVRKALQMQRRLLGPEHLDTATSLSVLALALEGQGHSEAAEESARRAVEILTAGLLPDHPLLAEARGVLGACLVDLKRFPEAEALLLDSYSVLRSMGGDDAADTRDARQRLVRLYEAWGKPGEAARYRRAAEMGANEAG